MKKRAIKAQRTNEEQLLANQWQNSEMRGFGKISDHVPDEADEAKSKTQKETVILSVGGQMKKNEQAG